MPDLSRVVRRICFAMMLSTGLEILCLGLASRNGDAPLHQIAGVPLWLILDISLGAWTIFGLAFLGIILHYARIHPIWALLHFLTILLMMAFFATYLHFEPFDLNIWGPLAVDLGLVVSTGIEATYNSVDRGLLRRFLDYVMGNENHTENGGNGNNNHNHGDGYEMDSLRPNGRRRSNSV